MVGMNVKHVIVSQITIRALLLGKLHIQYDALKHDATLSNT
jgi:hypothetical protein